MEIETSKVKDILKIITTECAEAIVFRNKVNKSFDEVFQIKLREQLAFCTHTYEIRYSGWFVAPNGQYYFCDDGSKPPDEHINFRSGFSFHRGAFKRGEQETAKAGWDFLRLAKNDTIGILFLFAHLGLLYNLFEEAGYPPRVLLFIEGPTGSLKTAVSSLIFNFSGLPEQRIPATFRDTSASMEIKFAKYRDRILLVDDFCPAADASSRRVMEASLEQLVRFFGDGIAKGRANPSMSEVKELKPCGLVAMTGEDSAGSQSSLLRCLFLTVEKDSFDKVILHQYQENPSLWTEYLAQFVAQIAPKAPKVIKYIKKHFPIYRTEAEKNLSEKRLVDVFACLSIAADLAVAMAEKYLPIDNSVRSGLHTAVPTVCQNSEQKAKTASPVRIFCQKLLELRQQNKVHLATPSSFKMNPDEYLGFEKDGFWFLWPDETYSVIYRSYQATGKVFPKSQSALWGDLASAGVLIAKKSQLKNGTERLEYGTKIGFGDRPRMLKYVNEIAKKYAPETVHKDFTILSFVLQHAADNGLCKANPASKSIHLPKIEPPDKHTYNQEEYDTVYSFAKDHINGLAIMLPLETGITRSELLGLRWDDIDTDAGTKSIRQGLVAYEDLDQEKWVMESDGLKNKYRQRTIPIVDDALLDRLRSKPRTVFLTSKGEDTQRTIRPEFVFHSPEGKPYQPQNWSRRVYNSFMKDLRAEHPEIPRLTPHELRHTRATLWLAQGVSPLMVAKLLGHCDLKMLTRVYDHTSVDTL